MMTSQDINSDQLALQLSEEKVQSFFVNSYVEWLSAFIAALALIYPSWISLFIAITTQVLLIGLPLQIIKEQSKRLKIYNIVVSFLIIVIVAILLLKAYIVEIEPTYNENIGIYILNDTDETLQVVLNENLDLISTFIFETLTLVAYILIWYITWKIKAKVDLAKKLHEQPSTYFCNRHFTSKRRIFKYTFLVLTLFEVLSMPDLLALPVLYSFLFIMIFAINNITNRRNRMSIAGNVRESGFMSFSGDSGIAGWAMYRERLFGITLFWQKIVMMIQLFEYIVTHISSVRKEILQELSSESSQLNGALYFLRCVGHAEYQSIEGLSSLFIVCQMFLTISIIFFGQISEKAYAQYWNHEDEEADGFDTNFENENKKEPLFVRGSFYIFQLITRNTYLTLFQWRRGLYGFLPVLLNWFIRISVVLFAYMYNSHVGFYHLVWVIASFLTPLRLFYTISVIVMFPTVCLEFAFVYVANIRTFNNARVYQHPVIDQYLFHPIAPFFELTLIYSMVMLVGLMIPARMRFISYYNQHRGNDMTKDLIIKNITDKRSSVFWKVLFIVLVNLRTPILFLMLFIGNQNFNLFQLGFMIFFVVYGASDYLYSRTSIMLPLFISYFILSQYYWSLVYPSFIETYNTKTDFLFLVDGWNPPQDFNDFYWARLPNLTLWCLLIIMHILHSICQQFPDHKQNIIYVETCYNQISSLFPVIARWMKLAWDFIFMLVLVTVLLLMAKDLIQQQANMINLVYLVIFVITFGKMCQTSLDASSHKVCISLAKVIKLYSAIILLVLVIYHMFRFEFLELNEFFEEQKEQKSFIVLLLSMFGFSEDESGTKSSVQRYTAYLIVGQILEYHFNHEIEKYESRDLFDWDVTFKSYKGVKHAHEFFQFDIAYMAFRILNQWSFMDFVCTYFHIFSNGIIVYFSITVSVSVFFAVQVSIIVFFYCFTSFQMRQMTRESGQYVYDIQQATDVCRKYKKLVDDTFLRSRQNLWTTQYVLILVFLFIGYFDEFVDMLKDYSDDTYFKSNLEIIEFYLFWCGSYFPPFLDGRIKGLQPVHILFLIILMEKQAQNWLYSRWGLNKTMITNFSKLEFYRKINIKGKKWLPQEKNHPGKVRHPQDIMEKEHTSEIPIKEETVELKKVWMMEEINNKLAFTWREVKQKQIIKRAIAIGLSNRFQNQSSTQSNHSNLEDVIAQLASEEHIYTMTKNELEMFLKVITKLFQVEIDLESEFKQNLVQIEDQECVFYQTMKNLIIERMKTSNLINLEEIPFLAHSYVKTLKAEIQKNLTYKFLDEALFHNAKFDIDIRERVQQEKAAIRLQSLRREILKIVNRRYSYEMWGGLRIIFEQFSLALLLLNVVIKCNIISLVYLVLVTNFLIRKSKQKAMRNMVYIVGSIFFSQYWIYLFNLTSESSPTKFPNSPYPSLDDLTGKYLIPVMYKFEFGRNMKNAYYYSFGVELTTVQQLWLDFFTLVLVATYLYYYRNPVLSTHCQGITWCTEHQDEKKRTEHVQNNANIELAQSDPLNKSRDPVNFWNKLAEYHQLMNEKYPSEQEYSSSSKRLREIKDSCQYYGLVRNAKILIFTTMHIFTMIVILLMALCRRSFVSIGYVLALGPCLLSSASVLDQHKNYEKQENELEVIRKKSEFQSLTLQQQLKNEKQIKSKYQWSFINLICVYLSIYSYFDFVSQVVYQIQYIPEFPNLVDFGLTKIYPSNEKDFDYKEFVSGTYNPAKMIYSNLLMQIFSCVILCTISTQAELFKSKGYINFLQKPHDGLDKLMKLAQLKKMAITYSYNNAKMTKILAVQKTEQQIYGCVDRIKLNVDLFRKSQQRAFLKQHSRQYGQFYIAPPLPMPLIEQNEQITTPLSPSNQQDEEVIENSFRRLSQVIKNEKQRREKIIQEKTIYITQKILPFRANVYLFIMSFSQNYIFIHRDRDMLNILSDMEHGRPNTGVDLIRIIRSDLFAYLKRWEQENGHNLEKWPKIKLQDLRQTYTFCKWQNIFSRLWAALFRALISNSAIFAYAFMLLSMYTNAGIVAIIYPIAVFGYALLEETRPGKIFWRSILTYSLTILLMKYLVNLKFIHNSLENTNLFLIDGFIKFGLHHLESTKDLLQHMIPEILIVSSILCHEIVEQFTGLYDKSEYQVENISQAIDRIFKKNRFSTISQRPTSLNFRKVSSAPKQNFELSFNNQNSETPFQLVPLNEYDHGNLAFEKSQTNNTHTLSRVAAWEYQRDRTHSQDEKPEVIQKQQSSDYQQAKFDDKNNVQQRLERKLNEINSYENLRMTFDDVKSSLNSDDNFVRPPTETIKLDKNDLMKAQTSFDPLDDNEKQHQNDLLEYRDESAKNQLSKSRNSFWKSTYMKRIFPLIQQQKPGVDYYFWTTLTQVFIAYYLLKYFNDYSATGPYQEQNIFQSEMIAVLFYQIVTLITERYIARTENRKQIERTKRTTNAVRQTVQENQLFMPVQHNELTVRMIIQKLKFQDLGDKGHLDTLSKLRQQQDVDINISESIQVTPQQKCKFILHWVNLIVVHAYIFWYMPIQANTILYGNPNCGVDQIYGCKDFTENKYLQNFYLLYLLYFYFSAKQLSQGLPNFRRGSSTMQYEGNEYNIFAEDIYNGLHQLFVNIPLAVEIRCLLDFTFTKTSLDLWQTCQLFMYNSDFYIAKTSNRVYNRKKLGSQVSFLAKFCNGYLCTAALLTFILGPFILFSNVGGMTSYNPVIDNDLQFWVQVNLTTNRIEGLGTEDYILESDQQILPFKIYDNESPSIYNFDEKMFKKQNFDKWPDTKFFDPQQIQLIISAQNSDNTWIASDGLRAQLQKFACLANMQFGIDDSVPVGCLRHLNDTSVQNVSIGFQLKTTFVREGPVGAQEAVGIQQRNLNIDSEKDRYILSQFSAIMTETCDYNATISAKPSYTLNITDFFMKKLLLGESTDVEPIFFSLRETEAQARQNILLKYQCKDQWSLSTGQGQEGEPIQFMVFSQRITVGWLQGYDVMTFILTFVIGIGMYLRPIFIHNTHRAFIYETNYPDPMLRLCESIHLHRTRGELEKEDENYRLLLEILRSPELMHALTGSNMKGEIAPSEEEKKSHLIPKAFN